MRLRYTVRTRYRSPHTFRASDPVLPNDIVLVTGEAMQAVSDARVSSLPDVAPSGAVGGAATRPNPRHYSIRKVH